MRVESLALSKALARTYPHVVRATRTLLLVAVSWILAAAAACGGGDDNSGNTGNADASTDTGVSDTSVSDTGTSAAANASDVDVYAGQVASLDASGSSPAGASFAWTVASVPPGSNVTTASLANANSAKPTLPTDVVGDYVLQVTVTAGTASATASPKVHAHPGKIAFAHTTGFSDGGAVSQVELIHTDGTGRATVSCATSYEEVAADLDLSAFGANRLRTSLDWYEGKPQDPARVAFGFREIQDDGGFTSYLAIGDESTRCTGTPPQKFDVFTNTGDVPRGLRISPNGDRVAYMRNDGSSGLVVVTMGLDGSNQRILGPVFINGVDGGALVAASLYRSVPVQWTDETHVAWLAYDDAQNWEVRSATDSATPGMATVITCQSPSDPNSTSQPNVQEIAVLSGGDVLAVTHLSTIDAGPAATNLFRLHPNASTKACELVGVIGAGVTDFALSPDRTALVVTMSDVLYYASVDGLTSPRLVPGTDGGIFATGQRYIAGGTLLSTVGGTAVTDGGSTSNVMTIPADGGASDTLVAGTDLESFNAGSNTGTCSIGIGRASSFGAPFAAISAILLSFGLRRRGKRNAKGDS